MTEEEFKQKYRVSRDALDHIYEKIKDHNVFKYKRGRKQIDPKHQLMVLLQYLGTEGSGANDPKQRAYFRIGRGSARNNRKRARDAILSLSSEYYYWPDEDERKKVAVWFRENFNLHNCVGVIDGTLFPLEFRPETEDAADYHGRKFQWSLTCLVTNAAGVKMMHCHRHHCRHRSCCAAPPPHRCMRGPRYSCAVIGHCYSVVQRPHWRHFHQWPLVLLPPLHRCCRRMLQRLSVCGCRAYVPLFINWLANSFSCFHNFCSSDDDNYLR